MFAKQEFVQHIVGGFVESRECHSLKFGTVNDTALDSLMEHSIEAGVAE